MSLLASSCLVARSHPRVIATCKNHRGRPIPPPVSLYCLCVAQGMPRTARLPVWVLFRYLHLLAGTYDTTSCVHFLKLLFYLVKCCIFSASKISNKGQYFSCSLLVFHQPQQQQIQQQLITAADTAATTVAHVCRALYMLIFNLAL